MKTKKEIRKEINRLIKLTESEHTSNQTRLFCVNRIDSLSWVLEE